MKILSATSLTAFTVAAGLGGAAAAQTEITWGDHLPECCSMYAEGTKWMVDEVAERSGGDLTIDVTWGGVLASVGEVPTAIENGVIDAGNVVTPYFPDQFVINNAVPFFWPQPRTQEEIGELILRWHEEYPAFGEELDRYNQRLIGVRPLPPYGMICSSPIRSMEDFEGKRIRSYGVALPAMLEAIGAVPVGMADVEAYEAMANNILDCSVADIALVEAFQLSEVGSYFIDVPMGASWGHLLTINNDVYDSLSPEHQQILEDMKSEQLDAMLRMFRAEEERIRNLWAEEGTVEIIEIPDEEFLEVVLSDPGVQAVRESWPERAIAAGMPEEQALAVVSDITAE